jgi:hydrogenase maturation factor
MTTAKLLTSLLIAALFSASASAFAADNSVNVTVANGNQQATFSLGDSKCVLVNDVVTCVPVVLASN